MSVNRGGGSWVILAVALGLKADPCPRISKCPGACHLSRLTKWSLWLPTPTPPHPMRTGFQLITHEKGCSSFSLTQAQRSPASYTGNRLLCEGLEQRFGERQVPPGGSHCPLILSLHFTGSTRRGRAGTGVLISSTVGGRRGSKHNVELRPPECLLSLLPSGFDQHFNLSPSLCLGLWDGW